MIIFKHTPEAQFGFGFELQAREDSIRKWGWCPAFRILLALDGRSDYYYIMAVILPYKRRRAQLGELELSQYGVYIIIDIIFFHIFLPLVSLLSIFICIPL